MKRNFKGIIFLIIIVLLTAAFAGCGLRGFHIQFNDGNVVVGNGKMDTKTVTIEQEVTGVKSMGSFDVIIDPSLEGEAIIEGDSNVIDLVELNQDSTGDLTVSMQDNTGFTLRRHMTVRIPAVNGGLIELDGSGNITLDANEALKGTAFRVSIMGSGDIRLMLETSDLEVLVSGSGDVDLKANTQQLKAGISGSGRIRMDGSADNADISINGSGDFDGLDCVTQRTDVSISGSGDINVNVASELTGSINGSGDLTYTGDPATVSISDNGSGDVRKR